MTVKHNLSTNMSEQDLEQLDATNPNDEPEVEEEQDDTEDVEALKAELEKERQAKRQIFARLKKQGKPHIKNNLAEDVVKDISDLKLAEKKRQYGYKLGLSPEETDNLFRFAGNEDPEETFKNTFFQAALRESRKQQDIDEATPSVGNRSIKVDGKTFKEMNEEERKANWPKITAKAK